MYICIYICKYIYICNIYICMYIYSSVNCYSTTLAVDTPVFDWFNGFSPSICFVRLTFRITMFCWSTPHLWVGSIFANPMCSQVNVW